MTPPPATRLTRPRGSGHRPGRAWFAGVRAFGAVESIDVATESGRLSEGGFWAVVGQFEGAVRAWRFADVVWSEVAEGAEDGGEWRGPPPGAWESSMSQADYCAGVAAIRERIRAGDVYQVNLCRVLSAALPGATGTEPDAFALARLVAAGNPAPYAGGVHVPGGSDVAPVWIVSASPELFLRVRDGQISSGPIKGTAPTPGGLTAKDEAENIMITDMVRNDLQRLCRPGTVEVSALLEVQRHPGLAHLVTTVEGELDGAPDWSAVLRATYPPASVSGAPKHTALQVISALEPVHRGPYCGMVGWIDADRRRAELAVGIRTFWWTGSGAGAGLLRFGTGAGITWDSIATAEWAETELKAGRLIRLASEPVGQDGATVEEGG